MEKRAKKGEPEAWLRAALLLETDECIEWPFGCKTKGYGSVVIDGVAYVASNWVCRQVHGAPTRAAPFALHECDNRPCVNKRHLHWGDQQQNMAEASKRGRMAHGERHHLTKVTEADVREIRRRGPDCIGWAAYTFGVSTPVVQAILERKTWKHVV